MLLAAKLATARAVGALARRSGRGGGTSLPGKVLMRLEPHALRILGGRLEHGSAVISATNGKTTTAAMAASILQRAGARVVRNRAGANMSGGIASTLLEAVRPGAAIDGDTGLFEVDEMYLAAVAGELQPRAMLLCNLFRDQLDRYGELESIAERWAQTVAARPQQSLLALGADDPLVAALGEGRERVTYFGVEDGSMAIAEMQHAADSKHCRSCGAPLVYDAIYLGHLGRYHCPGCGRARPRADVAAERVRLNGTRGSTIALRAPAGSATVELPLPGLYNVYNALGAAALTLALGAGLDDVVAGLEGVEAAFGRAETLPLGDRELAILLIKNPAGANEVLRTLALEPGELDLLIALNDGIADGRDISWIWDTDFELATRHVRRVTCAGTRAAELALRLKYAGWPVERLVVRPELAEALDAARRDGERTLYALPTYTALLELRELLTARGLAPRYWS